MIRRLSVLAAATLMVLGMIAGPAAAHVLVVSPPGGGQGPEDVRAGGGPLPESAQGEGLIPAGPNGMFGLQSPAHGKGLNTACESLRANGNGVVDIFGPPTPAGCPHGT